MVNILKVPILQSCVKSYLFVLWAMNLRNTDFQCIKKKISILFFDGESLKYKIREQLFYKIISQ